MGGHVGMIIGSIEVQDQAVGISTARQIDILLSTYNGEDYLVEQLESIFAQDINDWHLLVRDDGSTDKSVSIIDEYASRFPDKITVIAEPIGRLGIPGAYECLLMNSSSPYIAFCDQDDVWLPNKLRLLKECVQHLEDASEDGVPILVHSDLSVVNKDLVELAGSLWKYQHLNPLKMQSLEKLLIQNCVTGCSVMVNKELVDHALPIPKDAIMHDWWFALLAAADGKIKSLSVSTMKYRQHGKNSTGAKKWSMQYIFRTFLMGWCENKIKLQKTRLQALAMLEHGCIKGSSRRVVKRYVEIYELNWFLRRVELIRNGYLKYGVIRNIAIIILI